MKILYLIILAFKIIAVPVTIIISRYNFFYELLMLKFYQSLLVDLGKFMTVLFLFLIGFSMLVTAMNTPFYDPSEVSLADNGPVLCSTVAPQTETTGKSKF